jgi:hypothetical protein
MDLVGLKTDQSLEPIVPAELVEHALFGVQQADFGAFRALLRGDHMDFGWHKRGFPIYRQPVKGFGYNLGVEPSDRKQDSPRERFGLQSFLLE